MANFGIRLGRVVQNIKLELKEGEGINIYQDGDKQLECHTEKLKRKLHQDLEEMEDFEEKFQLYLKCIKVLGNKTRINQLALLGEQCVKQNF